MALTRTLANMRADVRKFTDTQGTTALQRHPDADVNDYINRALGSLHRRMRAIDEDHRVLSTTSFNTVSGTTTYALPASFDFLISIDITIDGTKLWLTAYEMNERPQLTSTDITYTGKPLQYRLRGSNIELLPSPTGVYPVNLWYVPNATQLSADGDTFDTIARLDDYVIAYASRFVATKDKNWDLLGECKQLLGELEGEIDVLARGRDKNDPPSITDDYQADRWGRRARGWR